MKVVAYIVNAFTANGASGNPAGVVLNADVLSDGQMLAIATEIGFSETAFLCQSKAADYHIRFFATTGEVDLCGHATIAIWSLLRQLQVIEDGIYTQETMAGLLSVETSNGLTYMQQTAPEFGDVLLASEITPILGVAESDFSKELEPQIVSTGLRDLMVVVKTEGVLNRIKPDFNVMKDISKKYEITGIHVATILDNKESFAAARNFAPLVGIDEESATGTSNGALLCYLKSKDALPHRDEYRIQQGKTMDCESYIFGKFVDERAWVGGNATVIGQKIVNVQ